MSSSSEKMSFTNSRMKVSEFRRLVYAHYGQKGRHTLPWRKTHDPYRILVSEMMLQQTQVERVIPKYRSFLKAFPTLRALASAPLSAVLKEWSGLGYNRRAKFLHDAARRAQSEYGGIPREYGALRSLPGIGDYTAQAIRAFAWNEPGVLIETNVRTAIIHHFSPKYKGRSSIKVKDADVMRIAANAAEGQDARTWHWALMDYGAHLKRSGVRNNERSAHYAKQTPFKGSLREVRGAILKARAARIPLSKVKQAFGERFEEAHASLVREGLISRR